MRKYFIVFTFFIFSFFGVLPVSAQKTDTINVLAQNKMHMGGYGAYDAWAVFPPDTNSYRKVLLNFTLGCPSGGCSAWDYTVDIYLNHKPGIKDSAYTKSPSFTVNGKIKDTVYVEKDTTYTTYYDTLTHVTDSSKNSPYIIVQYKDSLNPTTPTDTVRWWMANYYKYYYDSTGKKKDSILVSIDTTVYLKYYYYFRKYDSVESYEIARMITPYAGYYPVTWTYPYGFDVTDFDCMMHDSVQIEVFYSGWSDGFTATCNFQMITGIPPHKAYKTLPMWTGTFPYGNASDPISNYLVPQPVKIDSAASAVRLRILQTGHGEDNNNCSEFCANYQHIKINSKEHFTPLVWRDVCGLNPLYHQAGTWLYDRANWCPGEQITPYLDDLSPYVTPSQKDTIIMSMDPYISPNGGSVYTIGAELIYYGPISFALDASIDDIISPSANPLYSRLNPNCGQPQVVIRNTGSTPLTSLDIIYGPIGGTSTTYHWTGNLFFDDTALVTLPAISLSTNAKTFKFCAKVSKPNGSNDMYSNNDSLVTSYTIVPNYPSSFIIQLLTNNAGSESSYFIADDMGHIVYQKSGFGNSTLYKDTVNLPNGCYHFEIDDAGKDGLSFFANSDGNGSIAFYKLKPHVQFKTFQPDFGTSAVQNFTVGAVTGLEDEVETQGPDYNVYPNPAQDRIAITQLASSQNDKDIRIYSEIGLQVYSSHIKSGIDKVIIDIRSFAQGVYCLIISNIDGVVVKKVVMVH
jgi:hypothetical protein